MEGAEIGVLGTLGGHAGKCGVLEAKVQGSWGPSRPMRLTEVALNKAFGLESHWCTYSRLLRSSNFCHMFCFGFFLNFTSLF